MSIPQDTFGNPKACSHPGADCMGRKKAPADSCCGECVAGNHAGCAGDCPCPHREETVATEDVTQEAFESVRLIREEAMQREEPERSEILALADRVEEILTRE